jgi:hypothetical protein
MSDMFYTETELQESAYARILLTGDRKVGKTTAVLTTAPGPIAVLNCDGPGAPMSATRRGAKGLLIADVNTVSDWITACKTVTKMAAEEKCRTIVVDTVTLLVNNILSVEMGRKYSGFDIWRETLQVFLAGFNMLRTANAHLFVLGHYDLQDGQLTLDGKLKKDVPALLHDIVHLDFNPRRTPTRGFNIGPSASGLSGGRSCDESKLIDADVGELFKELGINP